MAQASNLLVKLARRLFANPHEQNKFIDALTNPQELGSCILWCQQQPQEIDWEILPPTTWQPNFIQRIAPGSKPGRHPFHEQGYFYCLDFSSVFAASILLTIPAPIHCIFDMCAAPGGKGIFAQTLFQANLLISNETIGKRIGMLVSNLNRCQIQPVAVVSRDSSFFAEHIPQSCDLVIVDAPCSGQSLLVKGESVPGCFHPTTINKNANRQKRILANSAQLVAPQGYLAYMTCTYSIEENEGVCDWLLNKFPQFQPVPVPHLEEFRSHLSPNPYYRMFPFHQLGAGAFTALFKNVNRNTLKNPNQNSHSLTEEIEETGEENRTDEAIANPINPINPINQINYLTYPTLENLGIKIFFHQLRRDIPN